MCQDFRLLCEMCAEEDFALVWRVFQGEAEGGFDLLVVVGGHGFTRKAGPLVESRRLRLFAGTFLQFLVIK